MNKRLFIAIPFPETSLTLLDRYCKALHLANVRWTTLGNLHITLHFLGDTNEELIPGLVLVCNTVFKHLQPFALKFKGVTFAPPQDPRRMIWAEYYNNDAYTKLVTQIKQMITTFLHNHQQPIHNTNEKSCIPHITLARCSLTAIPDYSLPPLTLPELPVTIAHLMESQITGTGPQYSTIETFNVGIHF